MSNEDKNLDNIIPMPLAEALSERYLAYSMSVIVSRALPDVRDGLKPVHRRLIYAMRALRLAPNGAPKKSARVVGDVIGQYHPHGDTAVYDAMVRLAQDFSVRYPLVLGQGNFGNIDGDSAAAMRYTEAKLTDVAVRLMDGLDEDAVNFNPTYDGENSEPAVMPGCFPNLLANGAMGIAVGMATNIPPHNVAEICDALQFLIKNREATVKQLVKYIKAPDFPTGGTIVENKENILKAYETGRGSVRLRSKWEREDLQYGNYQIVITEIPYQVQKSRLIEKVADLMYKGKLNMLGDIRDESDENIRIVIEPKSRIIEADKLIAQLFSQTDFEVRFSMNMNMLDSKGVPRVMPLNEILSEFIDHQKVVLVRRSKFKLDKILNRLEILDGLLIAYLNLDEIISIIRNNDEPKPLLIEKFNLTEVQAESILNMKLRSLRKLEEVEIKALKAELEEERKYLEKLLGSEDVQFEKIAENIEGVKDAFNKKTSLGRRYSKIDNDAEEIVYNEADFVERSPITVVMSKKGWIKSMKGHVDLAGDFSFKDGDELGFALHSNTADKILVFDDNGRFYTIDANKLPSGRGFGEPLNLMIEMKGAGVVQILNYNEAKDKDKKILIAGTLGYGFVCNLKDVVASTKNGKGVMNCSGENKALLAKVIGENDDMVAVCGSNRMFLVFDLAELPELAKGKGVMLQKYKAAKTRLSDAITFNKEEGISWTSKSKTYTVKEKDLIMWIGKRAKAGKTPPFAFPQSNEFS